MLSLHHESMNSMVMFLATCADPCYRACDPVPPGFQLQGAVCQVLTASFSWRLLSPSFVPCPGSTGNYGPFHSGVSHGSQSADMEVTKAPSSGWGKACSMHTPGLLAGPGIAWTTDQMSMIIFFLCSLHFPSPVTGFSWEHSFKIPDTQTLLFRDLSWSQIIRPSV